MYAWNYSLHGWVTIDQNTRDPNTPDHLVNCGVAATCAMGRFATGHHYDPEKLREMVGDPVDENTGTGIEVDQFFFNNIVPAPLDIANPRDERALEFKIYEALKHHHPIKVLQWFDEARTERHWRVIHAGRRKNENSEPEYLSGDPWTGETIFQTFPELNGLYQGVIVIPHIHHHHK